MFKNGFDEAELRLRIPLSFTPNDAKPPTFETVGFPRNKKSISVLYRDTPVANNYLIRNITRNGTHARQYC